MSKATLDWLQSYVGFDVSQPNGSPFYPLGGNGPFCYSANAISINVALFKGLDGAIPNSDNQTLGLVASGCTSLTCEVKPLVTPPSQSATGSASSASTTLTLTAALPASVVQGWNVFGTGIAAATTVSSISGATVTLSAATTQAITSGSILFTDPNMMTQTIAVGSLNDSLTFTDFLAGLNQHAKFTFSDTATNLAPGSYVIVITMVNENGPVICGVCPMTILDVGDRDSAANPAPTSGSAMSYAQALAAFVSISGSGYIQAFASPSSIIGSCQAVASTATSTTVTLTTPANINQSLIGWSITGSGIPSSTTVTAQNGAVLMISNAAMATATGVTMSFASPTPTTSVDSKATAPLSLGTILQFDDPSLLQRGLVSYALHGTPVLSAGLATSTTATLAASINLNLIGMGVTGTGIQAGTTVTAQGGAGNVTLTLSLAAMMTATETLTFTPNNNDLQEFNSFLPTDYNASTNPHFWYRRA